MSSLKATTTVPYMPVDMDFETHLEPTFSEWCANAETEIDSIEAEYLADQAACSEHYLAYLMHECSKVSLEDLCLKPQPTRSEMGYPNETLDFPF